MKTINKIFLTLSLFFPQYRFCDLYKCHLIIESNNDHIQYFDVGNYQETLKLVHKLQSVNIGGKRIPVLDVKTCIPGETEFRHKGLNQLDHKTPK